MRTRGPVALFAAWVVHDFEEAIAFPATSDTLARQTGIDALRMDHRQASIAIGLMGAVVAAAAVAGGRSRGRSKLYRAVVAGLEAHVATHVAASIAQRGYTAGVVTAPTVMWPGAALARRELRRAGVPLGPRDYLRGAAILLPAVVVCQALARLAPAAAR